MAEGIIQKQAASRLGAQPVQQSFGRGRLGERGRRGAAQEEIKGMSAAFKGVRVLLPEWKVMMVRFSD